MSNSTARFGFQFAVFLILIFQFTNSSAQSASCDVDDNGAVDENDIGLVLEARNTQSSGADDPRDFDGDGEITVRDGRLCVQLCTLPNCESEPDDPDDIDNDGDGFTENEGDCNDSDAAINPDATEIPGNGVDEDCDGIDDPIPNTPPVADAGADQTARVSDLVVLDGSGSTDVDGDPLTFSWSLTTPDGSFAILSESTIVRPEFIIDLPGEYVAQLIVNDGTVASAPDTTTISIENTKPVADAGTAQTARVGDLVMLDGSGSSDVDGDPLIFDWSLTTPDGSSAMLSDPTAVNPDFRVDVPGDYVVQLIVNDGTEASDPDTTTIGTENTPPVADAGAAQTVGVGDLVMLDGSGSRDVDGDPLSFNWSLTTPIGSSAMLSNATTVSSDFTVDLPGDYVAQLIVNDGTEDSEPGTATISTENTKPVADAGADQTVQVGDTVTLDGSGSTDVDGDPLTFNWSLTAPAGSSATLSSFIDVNPTFDVDVPGEYVAQLIVGDGLETSDPDTATISTENSPPVANAGPDQSAGVGDIVTLDGSGSIDVDGDPLTFNWFLTAAPAGSLATLSSFIDVNPTFVADVPGEYIAQLIVGADGDISAADTVLITVTTEPANAQPEANVELTPLVEVDNPVQLDGSGSMDPNGDPLTYSWMITSVPPTSTATLSDNSLPSPTFEADTPGAYGLQLVVNDGLVNSAPHPIVVVTQDPAPSSLACGDSISGSIEQPGEIDQFTFSGQFGETVLLALVEAGGFSATGSHAHVTVFSPSLQTFISSVTAVTNADVSARLLLSQSEPGTYTVAVRADDLLNVGSYTLSLECVVGT